MSYVRKLGKYRMVAALPAVVDLCLCRMDAFVDQTSPDAYVATVEEISEYYLAFLNALGHFANPTGWPSMARDEKVRSTPLPLPVLREVVDITRHLLVTLDKLPSSSSLADQVRLNDSVLFRLFSSPYLSPALREILLDHIQQRGIILSSWHWHECFVSAVAEGNDVEARRFLKLRQDTSKVESARNTIDDANSAKHDNSLDRKEPRNRSFAHRGLSPGDHGGAQKRTRLRHSPEADQMALSRTSGSFAELVASIEPYLRPSLQRALPSEDEDSPRGSEQSLQLKTDQTTLPLHGATNVLPSDSSPYSWSQLLSRTVHDPSVRAEQIISLARNIPKTAAISHSIVPVMHGLIQRGEAEQAWIIWRYLIRLAKHAEKGDAGKFIDNASLAVACEACHRVYDFTAAITLVDVWARRPAIRRDEKTGLLHSLTLDAQNVNVLLNLCKRDGLASVAFRLWAAALPRWKVYLNEISLGLLMDTARHHETRSREYAMEDVSSSLRRLRDEISMRRLGSARSAANRHYDAYDADGFTKGSVSVLLDAPGYSWRKEHGAKRPWALAREVFHDVVLGNWPHLSHVKSPLDLQTGPMSYLSSFFGGQYLPARPGGHDKRGRMPSEHARYTHIVPTPVTFYIYIRLIGYHNVTAEVPLVLAWMKDLDVHPTWKTMCWAMLYVAEAEGPSRRITGWGPKGQAALVRDTEVLRRWLVEWLGDGEETQDGVKRKIVPTDEDVTRMRMGLMSKNQSLTG